MLWPQGCFSPPERIDATSMHCGANENEADETRGSKSNINNVGTKKRKKKKTTRRTKHSRTHPLSWSKYVSCLFGGYIPSLPLSTGPNCESHRKFTRSLLPYLCSFLQKYIYIYYIHAPGWWMHLEMCRGPIMVSITLLTWFATPVMEWHTGTSRVWFLLEDFRN